METPNLTDGWVLGSALEILLLTNEMCVSSTESSQEGSSSARCWRDIVLAGTKAAQHTEERILESATFTLKGKDTS